jgi:hypothetical protein
MSKTEGINRDTLSEKERNALAILENLTDAQLDECKRLIGVGGYGIIGPSTLSEFIVDCDRLGLGLTDSAILVSKKSWNLGNGAQIGATTASFFFSALSRAFQSGGSPKVEIPSNSRKLSKQDIDVAAAQLGVESAAIRAVVDVESTGSGFLPDGRPKILFEAHIFYHMLKKVGIDPVRMSKLHPDICSPRWNRTLYKGGIFEYDRLAKAIAIHEEAALQSASWGLFQIMGFNHMACGFQSAKHMVAAMKKDEAHHLEAFLKFIRARGLVDELRDRNWPAFARGYNGEGYAANKYDAKLASRYAFHRKNGER